MMKNKEEDIYQGWIEAGERPPDLLSESLDQFLGAGPGERVSAKARRRALKAWQGADLKLVYFDVLHDSNFGDIFAASSDEGLIAVDFSCSQEEFLENSSQLGRVCNKENWLDQAFHSP